MVDDFNRNNQCPPVVVHAFCYAAYARSWRSRPPPRLRLNKLVTVIASNMVAEVCSIYIVAPAKILETVRPPKACAPTPSTRPGLKEGEGPGRPWSAKPPEAVNLSDAPADPHFSYRPETGEDPFKAFLGVPIVRGGQVVRSC